MKHNRRQQLREIETEKNADNKTKVPTKSRKRMKTLKAIKFHANKLIRKS